MPTCKICGDPASIPHIYCPKCLNNWLIIRVVIQDHFTEKYGEATRETLPLITQEINALNNLWKRNRDEFEKELKKWL